MSLYQVNKIISDLLEEFELPEIIGVRKWFQFRSLTVFICYASIRKGMDLRYIQVLLEHRSSESTEIYTHITRIAREKLCSPLGFLDIEK